MFEEELYGGAGGETEKTLQLLESNMIMLSDPDQSFVIGCRQHVQMGATLTEQNKQELRRIAGTLSQTSHNTLGIGSGMPALSVQGMLRSFANNLHILSPHEKKFAAQMAHKTRSGQTLSAEELQALINLYTSKGF